MGWKLPIPDIGFLLKGWVEEKWHWHIKWGLGIVIMYGLYCHLMFLNDQASRRNFAMRKQKLAAEKQALANKNKKAAEIADELEIEKARVAELERRVAAMDAAAASSAGVENDKLKAA